MRIDKYLWSVRYYKTRSIATQACKKGAVRINDAAVKPSRDVYPGDNVTLRKNQINYSLRVIEVPKSRVGPKLVDLYRVDTTPKEAFQQQELLKYSKEYYRKRGMGRPTKKDRRDIEDYIKEEE
ncbi:RNA-binding S4 domain-containing protein [Ulvibacter sp.]|jgi:ribosome-associated heat shock protein Hsp15|nr:RNA-binding S4 domain-containing protein [Bacteroidota bacterium]MDA8970821.1 RNA-binding S4 domain-containing protein [Flavobacteriaceae bacterium]MDB2630804.1 RNA-binding S4 domain-containing protein [Ulvibacter sp.]MBT7305317.1 RNA-binding S4 domain-containing protein [Bacteroidota bacterium]MDA9310367.1 RNA-binding S4 domain-containing protein [Flavobacteriaceae bacterium]